MQTPKKKLKSNNTKPTGMDAVRGLGKYVTTMGGALGDFGPTPKGGVKKGVKKGTSKMKIGGTKSKKK
jgi:hypothetical protein